MREKDRREKIGGRGLVTVFARSHGVSKDDLFSVIELGERGLRPVFLYDTLLQLKWASLSCNLNLFTNHILMEHKLLLHYYSTLYRNYYNFSIQTEVPDTIPVTVRIKKKANKANLITNNAYFNISKHWNGLMIFL